MARGPILGELAQEQKNEIEQIRAEYPEEAPAVVEQLYRECPDSCRWRLTSREDLRRDPGGKLLTEQAISRVSWPHPACDYCGKQFPPSGLERHVQTAHMDKLAEVRSMHQQVRLFMQNEFDAALAVVNHNVKRERNQASEEDHQRVAEALVRMVMSQAETEESYRWRTVVLEEVSVLLRHHLEAEQPHGQQPGGEWPKVYLFGSGVTGLAEHGSDVDIAAAVSQKEIKGDDDQKGLCRAPPDETAVLDAFFETLQHRCHPWRHVDGDSWLKFVGRTRVPIIQNVPTVVAERTRESEAQACTLQWPAPPYAGAAALDSERQARELKSLVVQRTPHGRSYLVGAYPVDRGQGELKAITSLLAHQDEEWRFAHESEPASVPQVYLRQWDLSLRLYGVRNSHLLRKYFEGRPRERAAGIAIKMWSRAAGINDPRKGLLSSYAVALMYVHFLLWTAEVKWVDPASVTLDDCVGTPRFIGPLDGQKLLRKQDKVLRLFTGFLAYYAGCFNWDRDVVTISRGAGADLQQAMPTLMESMRWTREQEVIVERGNCVRYHFRIEDPYEEADNKPDGTPVPGMLNVTRKVTRHSTALIRSKFIEAVRTVTNPDRSIAELFQR
eukprot:TRINITY_DN10939_c1_g1_i1.p1 TRINITY_DN10939_c1_g1~~TRINITY_DN10939_c1_g1_i1.p1  ORF type:complete len:612 (+),score=194.44 TRINITY_DN10939_c1_g1_i1:103-1938(+)